MEDDVTKVEISKTDITGDTEIEGAKLTITDENGNIVETWTSGKEPHYIEKLPIGKYTLKEEQAPNGYVVSEEITFEVADTAEIQKVAMKDDTAKGRLIIEKTDKDTGAALKGAEFELRDADGKVVETLTTDENGHATSGLLAIGTYKDGKFDKAATYYLVETKAPEGYQLDETKHEVTFTYVDDKTPVIEVIQKVTNEKLPEDTPSVSNPKTGDDTNLWIPALRERPDDIPVLAEAFLHKHNKRFGKQLWAISEEAIVKLKQYDYPGNARELENLIEQAVSMADKEHVLSDKMLAMPSFGRRAHLAEQLPEL